MRAIRPILGLLVVSVAVVAADRLVELPQGLNGTYFDGPDWSADRTSAARVDILPSTAALTQFRPGCAQPFSVEWRGFIVVLRADTYAFSVAADDQAWVYVRGTLVAEHSGATGGEQHHGRIALDAGVHSIFVRYFQTAGDCALQLGWAHGDERLGPIPASALSPSRVSLRRVVVTRALDLALVGLAVLWVIVGIVRLRRARLLSLWRSIDPPPQLAWLLLLSVALNAWGIWWGLPNVRGWAPDELVPVDVLDALGQHFSNGWSSKYPPFHYAVVAACDAPILLLSWLGLVDLQSPNTYLALFLTGRLVSVALGAGTILVVFLCGRQLYGSRGGLFAALTASLMAPLAYYGKLTNLDVPYLFWFSVSLLAYIRVLQRHERRDYVLLAVCAALAVCTKDQAYGLYLLTPFAILLARWQTLSRRGGVVTALFDRTTMLAAGIAIATFIVGDNLIFNYSGFVAHVKTLLGPASTSYQMFPATVAGQLQLAGAALRELLYLFGWPLTIVVALGVAGGILGKTTTPPLRWLLVPALSYYLGFIGVVLYFFDRFLLPIGLVLSLFAGYWVDQFVAPGLPYRKWRATLVAAVFAYSVVYVAAVDYALTTDSRYTVGEWVRAHQAGHQLIGARGPLEYFMIDRGIDSLSVESIDDVRNVQPEFVVLNADQMAILAVDDPVRRMHDALLDGSIGYRLALRHRSRPMSWPGLHPDLRGVRRWPELSSLSMVNPTMEVFARQGAPAITDALEISDHFLESRNRQ